MLLQGTNDLIAPDLQEWPDDGNLPGMGKMTDDWHARQAGRSRSTQEIHEDGFGLIISGMRRDNRRTTVLARHPREFSIASFSCRFFNAHAATAGKGRHIDGFRAEGDVPFLRQTPDKARIRRGIGSQPMIDMPDDKRIGLMTEKMGQNHGVRSAGYGRQNPGTRRHMLLENLRSLFLPGQGAKPPISFGCWNARGKHWFRD